MATILLIINKNKNKDIFDFLAIKSIQLNLFNLNYPRDRIEDSGNYCEENAGES